MCRFCGELNFKGSADAAALSAMLADMRHRGADGSGIFLRDAVGFVRLLSVIKRLLAAPETELTPKGHSKLWQVALLECWLQTHGV